jgi:hypothetical protein
MSGSTTELNLSTAVDADDNADYLTINLANSLRTLDGLFNNLTGHTHVGAHQGGPVTPATGSITSGMIADGTIATVDIAADATSGLAAFAQLAANQTTSTGMVAIPGTSVTLACTGGDLIIWWAIPVYNVTGANACSIGLKLDASAVQVVGFANLAGGQGTSMLSGVLALTGQVGVVSHTVAMYWSTVAGTLSQQPAALTTLVLQERRR